MSRIERLIEEQSRISATIYETETGFRPTPVAPRLSDGEWRACFDAIFEYDASYIVATGSLPVGVPPDFYARVAEKAKSRATRVVLDTSGEAPACTFRMNQSPRCLSPLAQRAMQFLHVADG